MSTRCSLYWIKNPLNGIVKTSAPVFWSLSSLHLTQLVKISLTFLHTMDNLVKPCIRWHFFPNVQIFTFQLEKIKFWRNAKKFGIFFGFFGIFCRRSVGLQRIFCKFIETNQRKYHQLLKSSETLKKIYAACKSQNKVNKQIPKLLPFETPIFIRVQAKF